MSQLEAFVQHLVQHKALSLVLASGQKARFRFGDGERETARIVTHGSLAQLVRELCDERMLSEIEHTGTSSTTQQCQDAIVDVNIHAVTASAWKISITPSRRSEVLPLTPFDPGTLLPRRSSIVPAAANTSNARTTIAPPPPKMPEIQEAPVPGEAGIVRILRTLVRRGGTDLHLSAGNVPFMRHEGAVVPLDAGLTALRDSELRMLLAEIAPKGLAALTDKRTEDFAFCVEGLARFRFNVFLNHKGIAAAVRVIPFALRSPQELGLPRAILDLCELANGLVLITGQTGCGKSTTLASLVDVCKRQRSGHIITIEDPIEFVHESDRSLISQREVGRHTGSFKDALRDSLREDPDIVVVGEMRDVDTMSVALETAETGHLVFGCLHSNSAAATVNRVVDFYPGDRQLQVRAQLAESLRAVITQVLCRRVGGGYIPAYEIMLGTPAISTMIREGKTEQLVSTIQTSRGHGMQTLNEHLLQLVNNGLVAADEALLRAADKPALREMFGRTGIDATRTAGRHSYINTPAPTAAAGNVRKTAIR